MKAGTTPAPYNPCRLVSGINISLLYNYYNLCQDRAPVLNLALATFDRLHSAYVHSGKVFNIILH